MRIAFATWLAMRLDRIAIQLACALSILIAGAAIGNEGALLPTQDGTSVSADGTSSAVDAVAAQNGLLGYDHRKQFQKKLLEFVAPVHKESLITPQLVQSLATVDKSSSATRKDASDQMSLTAAATMQLDQLSRITEQSIRLQILQQQGVQVGGGRSAIRAGGLIAKSAELKALTDLHREKVKELTARFEAERETRALRLENRISKVQDLPFDATKVISGNPQNVLINASKELLLKYGYTISKDPLIEKYINETQMPLEEIAKIRLRLDAEGKPLIFNANERPADLGKLPYAMQHPDIKPVARKLEARLEDLRSTTNHDFYSTMQELNELLSQLEDVSIATLGNGRENAKKGTHAYRLWADARDYRHKIRGVINRMEAQGDAMGDWFRQPKFDPTVDGANILTFAKYVVDNGCQIAPGQAGSESAYMKLHMNLLRLQAILEAR